VTHFVEFFRVFRLYARHHNPIYAARIAHQIVYRGLPF
jgi:hypothetical protein